MLAVIGDKHIGAYERTYLLCIPFCRNETTCMVGMHMRNNYAVIVCVARFQERDQTIDASRGTNVNYDHPTIRNDNVAVTMADLLDDRNGKSLRRNQ